MEDYSDDMPELMNYDEDVPELVQNCEVISGNAAGAASSPWDHVILYQPDNVNFINRLSHALPIYSCMTTGIHNHKTIHVFENINI